MTDLDLTLRGTTSLGSLLDALKECESGASVQYDFCYFHPTMLYSYRGYYEDLAFGYSDAGDDPTVADVVARLEQCIGEEFTGWKGGDYVMDRETGVWVANQGHSGGTGIVAIDDSTYHGVVLITKLVD